MMVGSVFLSTNWDSLVKLINTTSSQIVVHSLYRFIGGCTVYCDDRAILKSGGCLRLVQVGYRCRLPLAAQLARQVHAQNPARMA